MKFRKFIMRHETRHWGIIKKFMRKGTVQVTKK